jgi:hypothetical protein
MKIVLLLFLFSQVFSLPQPPDHSFVKKVVSSKSAVANETVDPVKKKVFVKFVQGPYTFKKRREKANRVTFSCNGCEKFMHYLPVMAWRERVDDDPEHDEYVLDLDTLPSRDDHLCGTSGIEDLVSQFREELQSEARSDPTQPFPSLYQSVRYIFKVINSHFSLIFCFQGHGSLKGCHMITRSYSWLKFLAMILFKPISTVSEGNLFRPLQQHRQT